MQNKYLKKRILDISYKYKLSHIGSCMTAVDIIDEIYSIKKREDKFILSSGHAGLALYAVLDKYNYWHYRLIDRKGMPTLILKERFMDAEKIWLHHGVHPDRCKECHIDCSSGSLGQGLPIAVGMALAEKQNFESQVQDSCPTAECEHQRMKNVYCLVSDGELAEGSIWEAIRIIHDNNIKNLKLYVNWNGYSAYDESSKWAYATLVGDPVVEFRVTKNEFPFLHDVNAHYIVMDQNQYEEGVRLLE